MDKRRFLSIAICAAGVLAVLLSLGVWQVQRGAWKKDLIARIEAGLALPAVLLPAELDDPKTWEYRRVSVTGRFVEGASFRLGPRPREGRQGYHLISALRTGQGSLIFVNRGWMPQESEPAAVQDGAVTLNGVVRVPLREAFAPDNDPSRGSWYWPDVAEMAKSANLEDPLPILLLSSGEGESGPRPIDPRPVLPDDHAQYAAFWFGMAGVFCCFCLAFWRKGRGR